MTRVAGVLVAFAVALTGCKVTYNVTATVERDGSGVIEIIILLDRDLLDVLTNDDWLPAFIDSGGPIEALIADVPAGWEAERVDDHLGAGVRVARPFDSVDEFAALLDEGQQTGRQFPVAGLPAQSKEFDLARGVRLTQIGDEFEFAFDADAAGLGARSVMREMDGQSGSQPEWQFIFELDLPGKVTRHNADEIRDGRLVWKLVPGTSRMPFATSDASQSEGRGRFFPAVGLGLLGTLVVGGAFIVRRHSRRGEEGNPDGGGPASEVLD